jgi:dimethylaniline monooxygenase (N-oxide forming)
MPFPPEYPEYPSAAQVLSYLESYMAKHNIQQYIHYNCEVIFLEKLGENYLVRWKSAETVTEKVFQAVFIGSGKYSNQINPFDRESLEKFQGEILNSAWYREPSVFEGKKVVVFGNCFSATDIAAEAVERALSVTQVVRRDSLALPRYLNNLPVDFSLFPLNTHVRPSLLPNLQESAAVGRRLLNIVRRVPELQDLCRLDESSLDSEFFRMTFYSDKYIRALRNNEIKYVKGNTIGLYEKGILLADGTLVEADLIVLATGYKSEYPFLSDEIKTTIQYDPDNQLTPFILYRSMLHPDLQNLCFLGMFGGPFPGKKEMQAEIAVQYIAGKINFTREELEQGLRDEEYARSLQKYKLAFIYSFSGYMYECFRILGIELDKEFIGTELGFSKGPVLPFFFNLKTEEQKEICRKVVEEIKAKFSSFSFS